MKFDTLKESFSTFWDSVAEGWRHLRESAAHALTRFRPGEKTQLPAPETIDDPLFLPAQSWSMLGGEVFEDERRVVVRLEIPGLQKEDLEITVRDDMLVVAGEKRFAREDSEGRWRIMQCAYGRFQRLVPLPAEVKAEEARATYRDGVLRIELPKLRPGQPRIATIKVE